MRQNFGRPTKFSKCQIGFFEKYDIGRHFTQRHVEQLAPLFSGDFQELSCGDSEDTSHADEFVLCSVRQSPLEWSRDLAHIHVSVIDAKTI
jgi:hypothetical protein